MIVRTKSFNDEIDSFLSAFAEHHIAIVKKRKFPIFKYSNEESLIHLAMAALLKDTELFDALIVGDQLNLMSYGLLDCPVDGKAISLHRCGELAMEGIYKHGQRVNIFNFFYPSGQLSAITEYQDGDVCCLIEYDNDGVITQSARFDENGKTHGDAFSMFNADTASHQPYSVSSSYLNGVLEGPYLSVYQNVRNSKRIECHYQKGKKHGTYQEWYPNGVLKITCQYKHGKLDGKYIYFDIDTKELTVALYKNGLRHGEYIQYSPDIKTIKFQAHYFNGLLDGDVKIHYFADKTIQTIPFIKGVPQVS